MRFNANTVPPQENNFEPVPKGKYRLLIEQAEERENGKRNGCYLWLQLAIAEGPYKSRKLWQMMTTAHQESEKAVEIGLGQISAMARAIGKMTWNHESELVGRIGEAYVGIENDQKGEPKNKVSGWVVPKEAQGAPTYTAQHQAHAAAQANVHQRGGQIKAAIAAPGPRPASDDPGYYDEEIPF